MTTIGVFLSILFLKKSATYYNYYNYSHSAQLCVIQGFILLQEKLLQFDWLRAVAFQLNLKYLHVKITNLFCVAV